MYKNKTLKQTQQTTSPTQYQKYTTAFASKDQRFNYKSDGMPGPGAYEYKTNNYRSPSYHTNKNYDKQSPIKRQHQWIWGSGRTSYLGASSHYGSSNLGPGTYQLGFNQSINIHGNSKTNWGKSERFYYSNNNKVSSLPGPGTYQSINQNNKKAIKSVFKSKSPRTFIQKLISQSSMPDLRKSQVQQFITNPQIISEQNQKSQAKLKQQKANKNKQVNSSVFASKIPRFLSTQKSITNLGPGSYDLQNQNHQKVRQKLPKIIIIRNEQKHKKAMKPEPQPPGPGAYDQNIKTIQRSLQQKRKIVICNQPRFAQKYQNNPGPGHYMANKNAFRAQIEKLQKITGEKPSFNTSSERSPPELPTKQNPLCAYNLDYYDLQHRVKKNQQHIQKLKIMDVTVPAFNSKAKR